MRSFLSKFTYQKSQKDEHHESENTKKNWSEIYQWWCAIEREKENRRLCRKDSMDGLLVTIVQKFTEEIKGCAQTILQSIGKKLTEGFHGGRSIVSKNPLNWRNSLKKLRWWIDCTVETAGKGFMKVDYFPKYL